jgi:hypothetical protein
MVQPRRKHRTATSRCIRSWQPISAFGISARLTGKIRTSYSRLLARTAVSPYPLLFFVATHLRPAAKAAGVSIEDGQRFGLHNLRHSLSNWLVNKAKVEPKTVQGILRHSRIQTTLDFYTQEDCDETRAAQGEFLSALGIGNQTVQ